MDPLAALISLMFFGASIFLLNVLTFVVQINRRKSLGYHQYPLCWILVANALVGALPLPLYGLKKYGVKDPEIRSRICAAWRFTHFLCIHYSTASIAIMVIDRIKTLSTFRITLLTRKHRLFIDISNIISWMVFTIFDLGPFYISQPGLKEKCPYRLTATWSLILNKLTIFVPQCMIGLCYGYICFVAYQQKKKIISTTTSLVHNHSVRKWRSILIKMKVLKELLAVIGSYVICNLPASMYYTIEWQCSKCFPEHFERTRTWLTFFLKVLVMSHALIVPMIFFWSSPKFRRNAKYLLSGQKQKMRKISS